MSDQSKQPKPFRELVGDVAPIRRDKTTEQRPPPVSTPGQKARRQDARRETGIGPGALTVSVEPIPPVNPRDPLRFRRNGVQPAVLKKLRLGKYPIEEELDLHHHSVAQAGKAVSEFIRDSVAQGIRTLLIIHGKGELRDQPARLKNCVNHWLRELDAVLAFHSARPCDGGAGATYVRLRKSDAKSTG